MTSQEIAQIKVRGAKHAIDERIDGLANLIRERLSKLTVNEFAQFNVQMPLIEASIQDIKDLHKEYTLLS